MTGGMAVGTRVAVIDVVRMFNMRNNAGETSGGGKARSGTVTGGVAVGLIIAVDTLVAAKSGFKCESNISGVSSGKYVCTTAWTVGAAHPVLVTATWMDRSAGTAG